MKQNALQRNLTVCAALAALGLSLVGVKMSLAADKPEKDSDIQVIMKKAFKGSKTKPSLVKKAQDGQATPEELKSLLEYTHQLQKAKPPQGEAKDWDDRNTATVAAVELLVKGDAAGGSALKAAVNCKECHKLHKPE